MGILRSSSDLDSDTSDDTTMSIPEEVDLGDDVLAEIITRLPVDAVARSRCVSKGWCDAVADEYLRRRLPLHMSMICFPDDDEDDDDEDSSGSSPVYACAAGERSSRRLEGRDLGEFFPLHESAVVCDGCNGMLLCRVTGASELYVVSPVTRRWVALPRPAKDARLSMLAFDPSSSSHYHVISFTGWRDRGAAVEVFSSETWAWAVRDAEFGVPAASLSGSMHYHDGAVYILASDPDCVIRMVMDVGAAVGGLACTVIDLPEPFVGEGRVEHSGGRLHYVRSDGELLKVWSLEEDDHRRAARQQWRLKHAARVDDLVEGSGEVRFLAMHPEKDAVVYMWSPWKVVEYDLGRREATGAAWEFANGARNRAVKTWLVPSSCYLSDFWPFGPARWSADLIAGLNLFNANSLSSSSDFFSVKLFLLV